MATPTPATRSRRRLPIRLPALLPVVVALALALGGLTGLAPSRVAAQDDVEQITQREFDRLTRAAQEEVAFGPEDGALPLEEEAVAFEPAEIEVESFLAHAEFTNPYAAADGQWDYGFQFRSQNRDDFLRLIVLSDGSWGLTAGLEEVPAQGVDIPVNDGEGDTNAIDLYADGDVGHFGVNGDYVATFELPVSGAGDISVGSGFLADSFQANAETGFAEFIVWTLDEGGLGPDDDLSDDDLTATAEAEDDDDLSSRDQTATARAEDDEPSDDDLTATAEAEDEDDEPSDDDLTATAEAEDEDDGDLTSRQRTATAEAEDEQGTTGDEPTYTSPTFGYTLSYDDPWEATNEVSDDDGDLLELQTDDSNLQIVGNPSRDDTSECVDGLIADVEDNPDVSNAEVATDDRDRELRDDTDELSWVVLFFTIQTDDGTDLDLTGYYECRTIVEGESLLTVIHLALSDDYNDEIENRTAVTDTIELDGGDSTGPTTRRTPTAEADDDEPTEEATQEATQEPDDEPTAEATSEVPEGTVTFILEAVGGSDVTVFGNIEPDGANASEVIMIALTAGGQFVTINEGTCRAPGDVAFDLGQVDQSGLLDVPVDAAVEDLTSGDLVMIVSTDGTAATATACGVLESLAG